MDDIDLDLKDLLPSYMARRRKDLETLDAALMKRDFATIAGIGHRIKGNAGNLGLDYLGALGAELESVATARNEAEVSAAIEKIRAFIAVQKA